MAQTVILQSPAADATRRESIPWHVWCFTIATMSSVAGVLWDISWHKSIGRDTFWTAPHVLIYICGILAGAGAAALILPGRSDGVRIWGFRGPLGAFIAAWGGIAMLSSAPFDDWWHSAYGLDVRVLSPPHVLLGIGMMAIRLGALLLVLPEMNRASGELFLRLRRVLILLGAVLMTGLIGMFLEYTVRMFHHTGRFYMVVTPIAVLILGAVSRACPGAWTATATAAVFTAVALAQLWILPLFPATPALGPVYNNVTHFIPNEFPLLLLAPALAMDWLRRAGRGGAPWIVGPVFLGVFLSLQWPFAYFLNSPASRNWIFGTHYIPYFTLPGSDYARGVFSVIETGGEFRIRMGLALALSIVTAGLGSKLGAWMSRLRR